jgi:serine protease AprX
MSEPACLGCGAPTPAPVLAQAHWYPFWVSPDGGCPGCVQEQLLRELLSRGDALFEEAVQARWPLDAEAAFGALPTPIRLRADPRFTGRGVAIALADSGFSPHPDLTRPVNRIRAWVDATRDPVEVRCFEPDQRPAWPGSDAALDRQWHGTMTSTVAAGNGYLSHGLYRGLASESDLVLIRVRGDDGRIRDSSIARALVWCLVSGPALTVRVVSLSIAGEPAAPGHRSPVEAAAEALVEAGIAVVAAAGNDGERHLVPPATAARVLTVGGLDDQMTLAHSAQRLWHSNYGDSAAGLPKPELVAPSLWVAAPVLEGTPLAREAPMLFERRRAGDGDAAARIVERKLVTPFYQHVDGTSFAAPAVASVVACMLEANPTLTPRLLREILIRTASPIAEAPPERQGAGALEAGRAVAAALLERHGWRGPLPLTPRATSAGPVFQLHDHAARRVEVVGSWDGWAGRVPAGAIEEGVWETRPVALPPARHEYKFLLDGDRWIADPTNPRRVPDGVGGINSRFDWP